MEVFVGAVCYTYGYLDLVAVICGLSIGHVFYTGVSGGYLIGLATVLDLGN